MIFCCSTAGVYSSGSTISAHKCNDNNKDTTNLKYFNSFPHPYSCRCICTWNHCEHLQVLQNKRVRLLFQQYFRATHKRSGVCLSLFPLHLVIELRSAGRAPGRTLICYCRQFWFRYPWRWSIIWLFDCANVCTMSQGEKTWIFFLIIIVKSFAHVLGHTSAACSKCNKQIWTQHCLWALRSANGKKYL